MTLKKRIFLVDDHPVFRRGLSTLIETDRSLLVCGEAASFSDALDGLEALQPDLALVDLILEKRDGLDLIKEIKRRHLSTQVLVVSMHDELAYAERCLRAGAAGYVDKKQLDEHLIKAIRTVLGGGTYMSGALMASLANRFVGGSAPPAEETVDNLSDRELQVFERVGRGLTTRQIAQELTLSVKTISSHLEHIKHKLNINSSPLLTRCASIWVETGKLR